MDKFGSSARQKFANRPKLTPRTHKTKFRWMDGCQ